MCVDGLEASVLVSTALTIVLSHAVRLLGATVEALAAEAATHIDAPIATAAHGAAASAHILTEVTINAATSHVVSVATAHVTAGVVRATAKVLPLLELLKLLR